MSLSADSMLLLSGYGGEELHPFGGTNFFIKGSVVFQLSDGGALSVFYTNPQGDIDAIAIHEQSKHMFVSTSVSGCTQMFVVPILTATPVHTYKLPPYVGPFTRIDVSHDGQLLAAISSLPVEILYVIRLNRMNEAMILSQLPMGTGKIPLTEDTLPSPQTLTPARLTTWISLSFCPDNCRYIVCVSKAAAYLVTLFTTSIHSYLVRSPIGVNFRVPATDSTAEFLDGNFISVVSPTNVRGPFSSMPISPSDSHVATPDGAWMLFDKANIISRIENTYNQSVDGFVPSDVTTAKLLPLLAEYCDLSANSVTHPHSFSEEVLNFGCKLTSHLFTIGNASTSSPGDSLSFLELLGCSSPIDAHKAPNNLTQPEEILQKLAQKNIPLSSLSNYFDFTGSVAWVPRKKLCMLACRNFGIIVFVVPTDIQVQHPQVNLLAVNFSTSQFENQFLYPPPPKTAFLHLDYNTVGVSDHNKWYDLSLEAINLSMGSTKTRMRTLQAQPSMVPDSSYLGDRRLMAMFFNQTSTRKTSLYDYQGEEHNRAQVSADCADLYSQCTVYSGQLVLGFCDGTIRFFDLPIVYDENIDGAFGPDLTRRDQTSLHPLGDTASSHHTSLPITAQRSHKADASALSATDHAATASNEKTCIDVSAIRVPSSDISARLLMLVYGQVAMLSPIYSHTYAVLGPVRRLVAFQPQARSRYHDVRESSSLMTVVFSEAICIIPSFPAKSEAATFLKQRRVATAFQSRLTRTGGRPVGGVAGIDDLGTDDSETDSTAPQTNPDADTDSLVSENARPVIEMLSPGFVCEITASLICNGVNLRAMHQRGLLSMKIAATIECDSNISATSKKILSYSLERFSALCHVTADRQDDLYGDKPNSRFSPTDNADDLLQANEAITRQCYENQTLTAANENTVNAQHDECKQKDTILPNSHPVLEILSDYVAVLSSPVPATGSPQGDSLPINRGAMGTLSLELGTSSDKPLHVLLYGTLDTGRLYAIASGDRRTSHAVFATCRTPLSLVDTEWYAPDPITALTVFSQAQLVITGHASGYARVFLISPEQGTGAEHKGGASLHHDDGTPYVSISMVARIRLSELPLTHAAISPDGAYIILVDSSDNMYLVAGSANDFNVLGCIQLKTIPLLTPFNIVGYAAQAVSFGKAIVDRLKLYTMSSDDVARLLRHIDTYNNREKTSITTDLIHNAQYLSTHAPGSRLRGLDIYNPDEPTPAALAVSAHDALDSQKNIPEIAELFTGDTFAAAVNGREARPPTKVQEDEDVIQGREPRSTTPSKDLHASLDLIARALRPTHNPFVDAYIPLLYNFTTALALTKEFIYISFANGDILRLSYPPNSYFTVRTEHATIIPQNELYESLQTYADKESEATSIKFAKVAKDYIYLSLQTMKPFLTRTSLAIQALAVDPFALPPPCALVDLVYAGLVDGRVVCFSMPNGVESESLAKLRQLHVESPLIDCLCRMRGAVTSLSVLHDVGVMAVSDQTGLTLLTSTALPSGTFMRQSITAARERSRDDASSSGIVPASSDMSWASPPFYGPSGESQGPGFAYIQSSDPSASFSLLSSNSITLANEAMSTGASGSPTGSLAAYYLVAIASACGTCTLHAVPQAVLTFQRQALSSIDSLCKQFLQALATQESMSMSGAARTGPDWKAFAHHRTSVRAAEMLRGDVSNALRLADNLPNKRYLDTRLWSEEGPSGPLYSHNTYLGTGECLAILSGKANYAGLYQFSDASEMQDPTYDPTKALAYVQRHTAAFAESVQYGSLPCFCDVSFRFAAECAALLFGAKVRVHRGGKLVEEVQKLRESCKELEYNNIKVLTDGRLDVVYSKVDLRALVSILRQKKKDGLITDTRSLADFLSRATTATTTLSELAGGAASPGLQRSASVARLQTPELAAVASTASLRDLSQDPEIANALMDVIDAEEDPVEGAEAFDVDKRLAASSRVPEDALRVSDTVTAVARCKLLEAMTAVERQTKRTILTAKALNHILETQLVGSSNSDEIGQGVCGLEKQALYVPGFPVPSTSRDGMLRTKKVCLLRSAQIVSERFSVHTPKAVLTRNVDDDEIDNANLLVFGASATIPAGHTSIYTGLVTNQRLEALEGNPNTYDGSPTALYNPPAVPYDEQDPFLIVRQGADGAATAAQGGSALAGPGGSATNTAAQEDNNTALALATASQEPTLLAPTPSSAATLYALLGVGTNAFHRAPILPYAQRPGLDGVGKAFPQVPSAALLASHESVSLRRALFGEAELSFAIRARQQAIILRSILVLLYRNFNAKLTACRDKKFRTCSRIGELVSQIVENSKEIVYIAKEETLSLLIERERRKIFTELQDAGISIEDCASRAAKNAPLNLPSDDVVAKHAMRLLDMDLLDVNTVVGHYGDDYVHPVEGIAARLGYNPYASKTGKDKNGDAFNALVSELRKIANQTSIEKLFTTVSQFLADIISAGNDSLATSADAGAGANAPNQQRATSFSIKDNKLLYNALLALTDEGLFTVSHLETLIRSMQDAERCRNKIVDKTVLRLAAAYKRALYDMMRGAIDAANKTTIRDVIIPTCYGLQSISTIKLSGEQLAEIEAYTSRTKELADKRSKDKRFLEAQCRNLREQALEMSHTFDKGILYTIRSTRFLSELKAQAIELAINTVNTRALERSRKLLSMSENVSSGGTLRSLSKAARNAALLNDKTHALLQARLALLRSAEKLYAASIKRRMQDPVLTKFLKQKTNIRQLQETLRAILSSQHGIDTLTAKPPPGGQQNIGLSAVLIHSINSDAMPAADSDRQVVLASTQNQLMERELECLDWLIRLQSLLDPSAASSHDGAATTAMLGGTTQPKDPSSSASARSANSSRPTDNSCSVSLKDALYEILLPNGIYPSGAQDQAASLIALPAVENPLLVSYIAKLFPLQSVPNITSLLQQTTISSSELQMFDVFRCTKLTLDLQIAETVRCLIDLHYHISACDQEARYVDRLVERHGTNTVALARRNNTEFVNMPFVVMLSEGQVEGRRAWDFAVDKNALVFAGTNIGVDGPSRHRLSATEAAFEGYDTLGNTLNDATLSDCKYNGGPAVEEELVLPDESSFIVLPRSYINQLNEILGALGERRMKLLSNLSHFRQRIKTVQHRLDLIAWQKVDTVAQTKDYQLVRVSRDMHDMIRENTSTTERRNKEVSTAQRRLEHTKRNNIISTNELNYRINAIPSEIQNIHAQNEALEARIAELEMRNAQRRQAIPEAEYDEVEADNSAENDKKFRRIAALRKMKELSLAQEEELQFLMTELEKLRRRTYPSFD